MTLLIKPASGLCNMRCKYCFYADEMAHRATQSYGVMSFDTAEKTVQKAIEYSKNDGAVGFMFQGGEPTLAGIDFFRHFVECIKKYNVCNLKVSLAIQTNGYAVNAEWAKFFADNGFLVGLSIDGPAEIHNRHRVDAAGHATFNKVMSAAALFKKYGVQYNTLTVVTSENAKSAQKIYNFLVKNGMTWQQFIPCLDTLSDGNDTASKPPLTGEEYGRFLCNLFDRWYGDMKAGRYVYNRTFENYVGILVGRPPEDCGMCGYCTVQFVVEADGSVYPCDFYALDEYRLGSLVTDPIKSLLARAEEIKFVEESKTLPDECRSCEWVFLCRGGCRRNREPFENGIPSRNRFCEGYKAFFRHSYPRMLELARALSRKR